MQRTHRAVMARVHGLQQVERLGSSDFAHDDPLGTHTQTVSHEVAHGDHALTFEVRRARFQTYDVGLLQLKFGGVFAGDDAFFRIDIGGHAIQKRGFARTGAAGDEHVAARATDDAENACARGRYGAEADKVLKRELVLAKLSNGERGPVQRKRRRDDVDAAAVEEARVAYGRTFVDAAADLAHDALTDVHQLGVVAKPD